MAAIDSDIAQDFEIVDKPDVIEDVQLEGTTNDIKPAKESIQNLFDQPMKPYAVQTLAKVLILTMIPPEVAWSTMVALISGSRQSGQVPHIDSDQQILRNLNDSIQTIMKACSNRLKWVDHELPLALERLSTHRHEVVASMRQRSVWVYKELSLTFER